ncbi:MAG: tetratricopeptide repeat protein [Candidatus Methylomirabilales bacterium]
MSRLESLERMLKQDPDDALLHYMLASEYFNAGRLSECVALLQKYLTLAEDEGAAYRTLAQAFVRLGKIPDARRAYEEGIRAAQKFEHPSMVAEYEETLRTLK